MTITIELPSPIDEELAHEAKHEGVSEAERAALLICLGTALTSGEKSTPFHDAVKLFLSYHSLDAKHVASVIDELVNICLVSSTGQGKTRAALQIAMDLIGKQEEARSKPSVLQDLRSWRNAAVHERIHRPGAVSRRTDMDEESERDQVGNPKDRVQELLTQWQIHDNTPTLPALPTSEGETPTQALFRKWEEEDALLTEEELEAEDRLWEEFQHGIDAERERAGMRTLF